MNPARVDAWAAGSWDVSSRRFVDGTDFSSQFHGN